MCQISQRLAEDSRKMLIQPSPTVSHPGPPVVTEAEMRDELGVAFQILDLHEFRFDEVPGVPQRFLGWSCLVEKH